MWAAFDALVEDTRVRFEVPGLAIGVVADGQIVHLKGYGVRNLNTGEPVTENTLFPIGSCTKTFTSYLLAQLIDRGLIEWEAPVVRYLPSLVLATPELTAQVTIADFLAHRTGLARYDCMWFNASSRDNIIESMGYLKPCVPFREKFTYNNFTYAALGELLRAVTGMEWEELIEQQIFSPLQMERSNTSIRVLQQENDIAHPHGAWTGSLVPIPFADATAVAPASAINSSAAEMVRWMQLQLDPNLIEREQMHRSWIDPGDEYPSWQGYGLGWVLREDGIAHGGHIMGFHAFMVLWPQTQMGVVVLCNRHTIPPDLLQAIADTAAAVAAGDALTREKIGACESVQDTVVIEDTPLATTLPQPG